MPETAAQEKKTDRHSATIRLDVNSIVQAVIIGGVVFVAGWIWGVEGRVVRLEVQAEERKAARERFESQVVSQLDGIQKELKALRAGGPVP